MVLWKDHKQGGCFHFRRIFIPKDRLKTGKKRAGVGEIIENGRDCTVNSLRQKQQKIMIVISK